MKQIINITLGGRSIAIEDAAYEKVKTYIDSLRNYFKNEEGRDEIVADIEARFAELMSDRLKSEPHVSEAHIDEMIGTLGRPEDFDTAAEGAAAPGYTPNFTFTERRRLYRDERNKVFGGVCSGIANWLNIDPTVVRVLFAIVSFGGFGTGIFIYIALWIFLPARNMEIYKGKRMFRDPDNKWFGGVAGGMGAYFKVNPNNIRLILSIPLLISILRGVNIFGWNNHFDIFPSLIFSGLTGTFIFIYIVLWIVLPEAITPYQKMEMRGQSIDVNTIKQNVQNSMGEFNTRIQSWGKEIKESAERLGRKAETFAHTRGKDFGREFTYVAKKSGRGAGYVIAMIFKAIFVVIGGIIAVSLLAAFLTLLFSGFAWTPVNNFLWTSETQQLLGWGTLILFIGAPIVGLVIWLVRKILGVRTPGNYLNWTFGGLWAIGWVCLMFFLASITSDFKRYESFEQPASIPQPSNGKLLLKVSQPELVHQGNFGWMNEDNSEIEGFSLTENELKISAINVDFEKSDDSLYHVTVIKQAMGQSDNEALERAKKINYAVSASDSILDLPAGFAIDRKSKYRAQNVLILVKVPVGKKISIDQSVFSKLSDMRIQFDNDGRKIRNSRNVKHHLNWYSSGTDYTMQEDGSLKNDADKSEAVAPDPVAGDNYRWDGEVPADSVKVASPAASTPSAPAATDTANVYRYNRSPSQNKSKEEMIRELERKQKEIDALKKKLAE